MSLMLGLGVSPMAQSAALLFDTNGAGPNPPGKNIRINAMDWNPGNVLAKDGNQAVANFAAGLCAGADKSACQFDVYTHAVLGNYQFIDGIGNITNIPDTGLGDAGHANYHEVTMRLTFKQEVTAAVPGLATFKIVDNANARLEVFWDDSPDSNHLDGFGFTDGRLILTGDGIVDAIGNFQINTLDSPDLLDKAPGNNPANDSYGGQLSVVGNGSEGNLVMDTITVDPTFFKNPITQMGFTFASVNQVLPYTTVDPSDCYKLTNTATPVGGVDGPGPCALDHVAATPFAGQVPPAAGGWLPVIGVINGNIDPNTGIPDGPDFVAQGDNSSTFDAVGNVPLPGSLVLLGTGFSALGFLGGLRKRKVS